MIFKSSPSGGFLYVRFHVNTLHVLANAAKEATFKRFPPVSCFCDRLFLSPPRNFHSLASSCLGKSFRMSDDLRTAAVSRP